MSFRIELHENTFNKNICLTLKTTFIDSVSKNYSRKVFYLQEFSNHIFFKYGGVYMKYVAMDTLSIIHVYYRAQWDNP